MVIITFGDDVFIGPCCGFYTAVHPINAEMRNNRYEKATLFTVGSNVVIGDGIAVSKDIPDEVVAFGNPCSVRREI